VGLFLSAILGGPEQLDKPFDKISSLICRRKDLLQDELIDPEDGIVNVVFQYSGTLMRPDFCGIRTGSFSKKKRILVIQIAFPQEVVISEQFSHHYLLLLIDALTEAKKYFDKKRIQFSLESHIILAQNSIMAPLDRK